MTLAIRKLGWVWWCTSLIAVLMADIEGLLV